MSLNDIPDDWSAQQALAVYQFLGTLRQRIRKQYGSQLFAPRRSDFDRLHHNQLDLFDPDPETPPF